MEAGGGDWDAGRIGGMMVFILGRQGRKLDLGVLSGLGEREIDWIKRVRGGTSTTRYGFVI